MNTLYALIAGVVLLTAVSPMLAQHQHGGESSGAGGHSDGVGLAPYNRAATDFENAIAVQATEEQSAQVRSWIQGSTALTARLDAFNRLSELGKSNDFSGEVDAFTTAIAADSLENHKFISALSVFQRSGLRKSIRELDKVNHSLAEALSEITLGDGQNKNPKLVSKGLNRARKALTIEQVELQRVVRDMGVNG